MSPTGSHDEAPPVAPETVLGVAPGATDEQIEQVVRAVLAQLAADVGARQRA